MEWRKCFIPSRMSTPHFPTKSNSGLTESDLLREYDMLSESEVLQFLDDAVMLGTAESFLAFAATSATSRELADRISSGGLTDDVMEKFVQELLSTFEPGRQFQGDKVLGLVAHLVRHRPGRFACRYLDDLSTLHCSEIPLAPRVARLILQQRRRLVSTTMSNEPRIYPVVTMAHDTRVSWSHDTEYRRGTSSERVQDSVGARFIIDATKPVVDWELRAA